MNAFLIFRKAHSLLLTNEKRQYAVRILSGLAISLLDIFGIILVGIISFGVSSEESNTVEKYVKYSWINAHINFLIFGICLFFVIKSIASVAMIRNTNRFLTSVAVENSAKLANSLFSKNISNIQKDSSQQISYSLGIGINSIFLEILGGFLIVFVELFLLLVLLAILAFYNLLITLVVIAYFSLVVFLLQLVLSKISFRAGELRVKSEVASAQLIQESIFSFRELYVSRQISSMLANYKLVRQQAGNSYADSQWVGILPKYALETFLLIGAVMMYVSAKWILGTRDPSIYIPLYLIAGIRMLPSMLRIQSAIGNIKGGIGNSIHTFKLIADNQFLTSKLDKSEKIKTPEIIFYPQVILNSISFSYPNSSQKAISEINLTIEEGCHLAIVGLSGSGKSTLVDLILGVQKPDTGWIKISGLEPREAISKWPSAIRYVPQSVGLINGTIAENIALRKLQSEAEELDVLRALHRANLDEIISRKEGIHSSIGERGFKLSGGQRQRLGIARAVFSNPKLIIFDEATSALDADTEETIAKLIRGLNGSTTIITIAHRLSTVRLADQIAYMDCGQILGLGKFAELRKKLPVFDRQAKLMGIID